MQHYKSIHYLRGLAAIMVCIFHIFSNSTFMLSDLHYVYWMQGGVDLFFVISGFVMVKSTTGRTISPATFMTQRMQRIVPLYWIATFATMLQMPGQWNLKIASLFFIPEMNEKVGKMQPILEPGWTLNYEMFFYLVFAGSLFLRESRRLFAISLFFLTLSAWVVMMECGNLAEFYGRPIIIEFVLGMVIAKFGLRLPLAAVPLGVLLMILTQSAGVDRVYSFGIPAMLIVAGALSVEDRLPKWRLADLMGSASYSIYLFHLLVLSVVVPAWPYAGNHKLPFVGMTLGLILLIGCGIYWALERPLIALFASSNRKNESRSIGEPAIQNSANCAPSKPHFRP